MMRIGLVVVAFVACHGAVAPPQPLEATHHVDATPADAAPVAAPRLVTEDEIRRYEAALQPRLAANQTRRCVRPVLHGATLAGPAAPDMLAIDQPAGALASCVDALAKLAEDNLARAVEARRPEVVAFDRRCGAELEAVVRKAVAHEDACSPFQVGVRTEPTQMLGYVQVALALWLRAAVLADRDPKAALWLALDTARFGQDLARGTTMINTAIGLAIVDISLRSAHDILERRKLARADLDAFAPVVDALIASDPPVAGTLAAEVEHVQLYFALAPNQPDGWTPPGGWPDGKRPSRPAAQAGGPHPRDQAAIFFAVAELLAAKLDTACPATGRLDDCLDKLEKLDAAQAKAAGDFPALYADLAAKAFANATSAAALEELRVGIRSQIAELLAGPYFAVFAGHVARHGEVAMRLAALRLHLDIEKDVVATKTCPAPATLASRGYPVALAGRELVVSVPAWMKRPGEYRIACP